MSRPIFYAYGPNPFAPERLRWAAAMASDGRPGTHWLATGPTEEAALAKLEAMWTRAYPETSKRGAHLRKRTSEPVAAEAHTDAFDEESIL
jgi:hypothetical protein